MRSIRASICVVGWLLLLVLQTGRAQEPSKMERPNWSMGDRWVLTWKDSRNATGRASWTLTRVGEFEGTQAYFLTVEDEWTDAAGNKRQRKVAQVRDMDFAPIGRLDERGSVVWRRKGGWLKWPLVVGEQWTFEGPYEFLERGAWLKRRYSVFVWVKGTEELTTPAGSFVTYHVYAIWRWLTSEGTALGHGEEHLWWSPQARFWVVVKWKEGPYTSEDVLTEYGLGK